jgi:hypothetical protein
MSSKVSFETARNFALQLPEVTEESMYGMPALKVHGKMFACVPSHKSAEPDSLVVRVDLEQRAELLAADPDTYYVTDHYVGYTSVLVRLARLKPDVLQDILTMAYRFMARQAVRRVKTKRSSAD